MVFSLSFGSSFFCAALQLEIFCLTLHNRMILFLALRTGVRMYVNEGKRNDVYPAAQPHMRITCRERITTGQYRARRWVTKIYSFGF
jgi:hypothetical protein